MTTPEAVLPGRKEGRQPLCSGGDVRGPWHGQAAWAAQAALWAQGCHELVPTRRAHRQRPRPHLQVATGSSLLGLLF